MGDTLELLDELEALVDSGRWAYQDWAVINPDGTDVTNPNRRYGPREGDDRLRGYLSHVRHIAEAADALRESAITAALDHSDLNNRQLAVALGISHPTVARRRREHMLASADLQE